MKKSLFRRYLFITMSVVLISYTVFVSLIMMFLTDNYYREQRELLFSGAVSISNFTSKYTDYNSNIEDFVLNGDSMEAFLDTFSRNIDSDMIVTNLEGEVLIGAFPNSGLTIENFPSVDENIIQEIRENHYEERGTFQDVYSNERYTVGVPLIIKGEDGSDYLAGAVFASTDFYTGIEYISSMVQIFLLAAVATLAVTFVIVWVFTYRMVRPLRDMSVATKKFARGEFTARVSIDSNDEIGELALAFNNMANSLANSEGMRRSFIANVSHELKTPMTSIGGFIDGILDGTIPPSKHQHYLSIVSEETRRLARLVKSMLDLSRIDSGEVNLTPTLFDISETLGMILLTYEDKIYQKNLEITGFDDIYPCDVKGDKDLLHQVIYNLIENAVKFTNDNGTITFSIKETATRVTVSVENTGAGIDAEDLPMIFDKFYKTDKSRSHDKHGLGLGLYLVRTIIQLHGGDIVATSEKDVSTKFEFYIPKTDITEKDVDLLNLSKEAEIDVIDVD